ncbi:MAG: histidinol-phosphatase [Eubacterium sp.]|nr:histidinol-phosphatase [Eubacterium sp.]
MSEYYANYHTHTTYCDGNSTLAEIVREAVSLGMQEIGFSGHSYTSIDESYCMSREGTRQYFDEISKLRSEYAGTIKILCGLERDYFADPDEYEWDFIIGSCHYIEKDGEYFPVDESEEILKDAADRLYGGDIYTLIADYYKEVGDVVSKTSCDIIGHFDLITKFNEGGRLFDESDHRYTSAWHSALDAITDQMSFKTPIQGQSSSGLPAPVFEINTGAMSRGYRTMPYPSAAILTELANRNAQVVLSSDSHDKSTLLYGFEEAERIAHSVGLEPLTYLF